MKWLVYFLLLVNVAFFAQQFQKMSDPPAPQPQAVTPYDQVNRLLLLTEVDKVRLRLRQSKPPPPVVAAAVEPAATEPAVIPSRVCYSIGPLHEDTQISALRDWLVSLGGEPALRVDERRELERYWVYLPPLQSAEQALRQVERMRAQGLEDVIAVSKGDQINAISLGVFSQRNSLERRLQELRRLGHEPLIMPRYSTKRASWFDVGFDQGEGLSESELAARFPEAELSEASCSQPEIAAGG